MTHSKTFDFNKFYELSDPLTSRPLRISIRKYSDWVNSSIARSLRKGQISLEQPIKLGAYMGRQITDFLWSDLVNIVCISMKVVKIFQDNNVTGWASYPVEVFDRKSELLPNYYGFSVIGKECRRDRSRSQIITKQAVPGGQPFDVYKGLYFYEEDWDGSDIFFVGNYGGIVVTEKVKRLFNKEKITNVKLFPLAEVERDVYLDKFDKES
jgi:hypothetical protein